MRLNIFQFGDTWWIQRIGTAMGTPVAVAYAMIFFAYFERTFLLPKYEKNIHFYKRQVDDILMIWSNNSPGETKSGIIWIKVDIMNIFLASFS